MTTKSPNRAANASIKGYVYQFDRTIIEVLSADDTAIITVEGVEDIDIEHATDVEAVQCKYLEASKFSLAKIRDAILPMVQSSRVNPTLTYRLYIYCGIGTVPCAMTLSELKQCLTYTKRTGEVVCLYKGMDDNELESFVSRLTMVKGEEFNANRSLVYTTIQTALQCSAEDSMDLYYGNALTAINDLAIKSDITCRKITKAELVRAINIKMALYTRWHKEVVGAQRYVRMLQRRAKACQILSPIMSRYLMIEHFNTLGKDDYITIITALAKQHYGIGKLSTAKPWTVVINCEPDLFADIKEGLITAEVVYNDGYEDVKFSPALFDRWPVINTAGRTSKIGVTSYDIRIVSEPIYRSAVADLALPDRILAITSVDLSGYGWSSIPQALQVSNISVSQIKELLGV